MKVTLEKFDRRTIGSIWRMAIAVVLFVSLSIASNFDVDGASLWTRVAGPVLTALFAYFLYWYIKTPEKEYMKAVKGEMSFQELKECIEAEEFEILFDTDADVDSEENLYQTLASENWLLLHVSGISRYVCIPKHKVREVHVVGFTQEDEDNGERGWCFLRLSLDDGKSFESGGERIYGKVGVEENIREHFQYANIDVSIGDFGKT